MWFLDTGLRQPGGDDRVVLASRAIKARKNNTWPGGRGPMKSYDVCECGAPLRLMERPTPKPTGSEVLLKVIAAGVCHSDLHIWEG